MSFVAAITDFHDDLGVLVERGDTFPRNAAVVRRFPHYFDPLRAATGGGLTTYGGVITRVGGETGLAGPSMPVLERSTSTVEEVPELDADAKPKLTVRVSKTALDVFRAELIGLGPALLARGYETGGNLIGRERGGVIEVIDASGPEASRDDRSERRFVDAVKICATSGVEIAAELREYSDDRTIMLRGGWHVHPIPEPQPSTTDRASALSALELLRLQYEWAAPEQWVDLILTPDTHGRFDEPHVHGWATRFLPWKGAVTEPVHVELA